MRVVEKLEDIQIGTYVIMKWRNKERVARVQTRTGLGLLHVFLEATHFSERGRANVVLTQPRYICSIKPDPAFEEWWMRTDKPWHHYNNSQLFGIAALAWEAAREVKTTGEALALAVLQGDDKALLPMVDRLIEQGKLPPNVSSNGEAIKYRQALEACLDACQRWNAGMNDIYEFIEARKLLNGESDESED
jgi:hypothetical protein